MSTSQPQKGSLSGCLGFLALLFLVGLVAGHMMSPDWHDRVTVFRSMNANLQIRQTRLGTALSVDCGPDTYWYVPAQRQTYHTVLPPEQWQSGIRHRGGLDETEKLAGFLFGGAVIENGVLAGSTSYTKGQRTTSKAAGFLAAVAVVGAGFYVGYDGDPDCEAAKPVYEDPAVWRMFEQRYTVRQQDDNYGD